MNSALAVLAQDHSREALTSTIVAPSCVVAVVLTGANGTVRSGVLGIACASHVDASSVSVTVIRALFHAAVHPCAGWDAGTGAIRLTLAHVRAIIRALGNRTVESNVARHAFAHTSFASPVSVAVVETGAGRAVFATPPSRACALAIITDAMRTTVVGACLTGTVSLSIPS